MPGHRHRLVQGLRGGGFLPVVETIRDRRATGEAVGQEVTPPKTSEGGVRCKVAAASTAPEAGHAWMVPEAGPAWMGLEAGQAWMGGDIWGVEGGVRVWMGGGRWGEEGGCRRRTGRLFRSTCATPLRGWGAEAGEGVVSHRDHRLAGTRGGEVGVEGGGVSRG